MKPCEMLRRAAEMLDPVHGPEGITERFAAAFALVATVCESMMDTLESMERLPRDKVGEA